jgi:hypothetical protein
MQSRMYSRKLKINNKGMWGFGPTTVLYVKGVMSYDCNVIYFNRMSTILSNLIKRRNLS